MISAIDWVYVLIYLGLIGIIGYFSSRKESVKDYLIADKKLGVFQNISTICSTKVTASVIITFVAMIYIYGAVSLWAYIGTGIGFVLFLFFARRIKREADKHGYYSINDYFSHRYGSIGGKIFSIIMLGTIFLNFTIQIIGGAKILESLLGISFILGVVLSSAVILFYLYLGGFKAVVKTDILQFVSIVIVFILILVLTFNSGANYDLNIFKGDLKLIVGFVLLGGLFPFSAPDLWQRVIAAKSVKSMTKSFIWSSFIYLGFGVLLAFIAFSLKAQFPLIDPDSALVIGFGSILPPGILGLGIVALFAAIMSSADSYAFICSDMISKILNKDRSKKSIQWALVGVIIVGGAIAVLFESIIVASILLAGLFMSLAVIIIAEWIVGKLSKVVFSVSLIVSTLIVIVSSIIFGLVEVLVLVGIVAGLVGLLVGKVILYIYKYLFF